MFPESLKQAINMAVPAGVTHIGFIPTNIAGDLLLAEPHGHPYGVSATFSKVKVSKGEWPSQALARCLTEQIGVATASLYPIPSIWVTPNSTSHYFVGLIRDDQDAVSSTTASLEWVMPDQARTKISKSQNAPTRQRDLSLLSSVGPMCLSPYRNVLLMIRELHRMGLERLRAHTHIYSFGTWRCAVVPAAWVVNENCAHTEAVPFDVHYQFELLFSERRSIHFYTSANEQQIFEAQEDVFSTPGELARKFIRERPEIAAIEYGPDPEYVDWFQRTLETLAPNGLFYSFSEYEQPSDHLYMLMARETAVPLPPPGQMDRSQWQGFFLTRLSPSTNE